jgi:flagellar hook-associated protein FlgK
MPGLFDGMRISTSGILAHRVLQEVTSQNVANSSNEDYTRQQVTLGTGGSSFDGQHFIGQGVDVRSIERVRDELLDGQVRNALSNNGSYEAQVQWLNKIESVYNEPSEFGVGKALTDFWESWQELSNDPESFAARTGVITRTENLTSIIKEVDSKLARFASEIDEGINRELTKINGLTEQIAQVNKDIFQIEAGNNAQANDLRDRRDALLNELSNEVGISYHEAQNGMVNVFIGTHPAVMEDSSEKIISKKSPIDPTKQRLFWEYGEAFTEKPNGAIGGLLTVRDVIIPKQRADLDTFATNMITEVNKLYTNGVPLDGHQVLESKLGYAALGVTDATTALNIVPTGTYGNMSITFYDGSEDSVRMAGIIVDDDDTLSEIADKLNSIPGLNAVVVSDPNNDGKLRVTLDTISGSNILGEASFAVSNNTGGYDSSGFLDLVGFSQTDKSTNLSAAAPTLISRDLTELQTELGEPNVTAVRTKALGLSGTFTINGFETMTEATPKTNGHIVQQFAVDVTTTDSIDSIIAKINTLTAGFGMAASFNVGTNRMEITSTAQTDANGKLVLAAGVDYLRLGLANDYRAPLAPDDEAPAGYTGAADTTGLLSTLQFNTLFTGTSASDISLDSRINSANQVHAGYHLAPGDNALANAIASLQHAHVAGNNQFTIGENYQNIIASVGTDVQQAGNLQANEEILLRGFEGERDSISGVNMDEELANMILYQRSYEANARMFGTFNQMVQEILNLVN